MKNMKPSFRSKLFATALVLTWSSTSLWADENIVSRASISGGSNWEVSHSSQVRLIAAKTAIAPRSKTVRIGVEIKLKPGWKTYWRTPGDSGVPPQFSWKGSQNLRNAHVLWPAPLWFKDDFGVSIGYKDQVVFPVEITPVDPSRPVHLKLSLAYAACKEVCIPVRASLNLELASGYAVSTLYTGLISRYVSRVPNTKPTSQDARILRVNMVDKPKLTIAVDVKSNSVTKIPSVFVEGPPDYYFDKPVPLRVTTEGIQRYLVRVDGMAATKSIKGTKLRITIVEETRASEHDVTVQ